MGNPFDSRTGSTLLVLLKDPTDPQAWKNFVRRYGPKILGWCRKWKLQEADAEDVTQEVLTKLALRFRSFTYDPHKGSFRGWLKTVTDHALSDYLYGRSQACRGSGDGQIQEWLENQEARKELGQALEEEFDLELMEIAVESVKLRVTRRDWEIFQALALEGRPAADVAQEFHMKVTAVLMVRSRVQKKLREEIQKLEGLGPAPEDKP